MIFYKDGRRRWMSADYIGYRCLRHPQDYAVEPVTYVIKFVWGFILNFFSSKMLTLPPHGCVTITVFYSFTMTVQKVIIDKENKPL